MQRACARAVSAYSEFPNGEKLQLVQCLKPASPPALKPHLAAEGLGGKMMKRNRETGAVVHIVAVEASSVLQGQ